MSEEKCETRLRLSGRVTLVPLETTLTYRRPQKENRSEQKKMIKGVHN